MGGIRVVARNSDDFLVRGANRPLKGCSTAELEVEAVLLGTRLVIENGWNQVEIESDSEVVIKQLRGTVHHCRIETTCSTIVSMAGQFIM